MSGLENIIKEIDNKAEIEAGQIIADAKEYCDKYMEQEREKIAEEVAEFEKKAQQERELYASKSNSGAEFSERNAVLGAKQLNINMALDKAYEKMTSLSDQEYFEMLLKILKANVVGKPGEILLGKKDLDRIPAGFEAEANKIAAENGGSLTLGKEAVDISDGFILRYGMIEENCTLKSLIDTKLEQLKDVASGKLFG